VIKIGLYYINIWQHNDVQDGDRPPS